MWGSWTYSQTAAVDAKGVADLSALTDLSAISDQSTLRLLISPPNIDFPRSVGVVGARFDAFSRIGSCSFGTAGEGMFQIVTLNVSAEAAATNPQLAVFYDDEERNMTAAGNHTQLTCAQRVAMSEKTFALSSIAEHMARTTNGTWTLMVGDHAKPHTWFFALADCENHSDKPHAPITLLAHCRNGHPRVAFAAAHNVPEFAVPAGTNVLVWPPCSAAALRVPELAELVLKVAVGSASPVAITLSIARGPPTWLVAVAVAAAVLFVGALVAVVMVRRRRKKDFQSI